MLNRRSLFRWLGVGSLVGAVPASARPTPAVGQVWQYRNGQPDTLVEQVLMPSGTEYWWRTARNTLYPISHFDDPQVTFVGQAKPVASQCCSWNIPGWRV